VDVVWALLGVLAVLHVAYSTWTAKRLDRLHRRVDSARAALDAQLRQRADAALAVARPGRTTVLRELAAAARSAREVPGLGHDREVAESALSRALQAAGRDADPDLAGGALVDVTTRTSFARRFHNDTVRDALVVRRRRVVRLFRLAGSARMPTFFEMDDTVLERRTIEV
jgi:hypothetical protein